MQEQELVGSRRKTLFRLAIGVGFGLIGLWMVRSPDGGSWAGWLVLGVSVLCLPLYGWLLVRPQRLLLDAQGFVLSGGLLRSPRHIRWRDIDGFFVYRLPRGGTMIGYNYTDAARPDTLLSRVNHRLGADAALPKTWPGSPRQIVADLNGYSARALGLPAPPS